MHTRQLTTIATYSVLTLTAGATFLLPESLSIPHAAAFSGPATVEINGVVRDFLEAHEDFGVVAGAGDGHYAGGVVPILGTDGRPILATTGGGTITGGGQLAVDSKLTGDSPGTVIDGYDSSAGPYGGANAGLHVTISSNGTSSDIVNLKDLTVTGDVMCGPGGDPANAIKLDGATITGTTGSLDDAVTMPTVTAPTDMGASSGDANYNGGTHTISSDIHCNKFNVDGGAVVRIDGDVRIHAESEFKLNNGSELTLLPGASLTVYAEGNVKLQGPSWLNRNSADPSRVEVYMIGSDTITVDNGSEIRARIQAPLGQIDVTSGSQLYGSFIGNEAHVNTGAGFHIDMAGAAVTGGTPAGYKVDAEWADGDGNPIAPHLYAAGGGGGGSFDGIRLATTASLDDCFIDGFDSRLGPYGGANSGGSVALSTNSTASGALSLSGSVTITGDVLAGPGGDPATVIDNGGTITGTTGALGAAYPMPTIVAPTDALVGPNLGNGIYSGGTATIDSNRHFDDFLVKTNAVVTIDGNITILVEGEFKSETGGSIQLTPGSTLDLYTMGNRVEIKTGAAWNDPRAVHLWVIGSPSSFKIETAAAFCGTIVGPDAHLLLQTDATLYGTFIGKSLQTKTGGAVRYDVALAGAPAEDDCGVALADSAGTAGVADPGGIDSADSFDTWFRDVPGVNQSMSHVITLTDDGSGVFESIDNDFHPIDGDLQGNEGDTSNFHFTYSFEADFVHAGCAGLFLEFTGGDGTWVFIDDQLVLDLGGMRPSDGQYVDLDRLGLTDGQTYTLRFFHAQRQDAMAVFRLRTSLPLIGQTTVTAGGSFD